MVRVKPKMKRLDRICPMLDAKILVATDHFLHRKVASRLLKNGSNQKILFPGSPISRGRGASRALSGRPFEWLTRLFPCFQRHSALDLMPWLRSNCECAPDCRWPQPK